MLIPVLKSESHFLSEDPVVAIATLKSPHGSFLFR